MSEMVTMIHIPYYAEICVKALVTQIRFIIDACGESSKLCEEHWQVNFDDEERSTASGGYNYETKRSWQRGLECLEQKKLAQITIGLYYSVEGVRINNSIGVMAVLLSHAEYHRLPRENGERWICIRIPMRLWKHVNQSAYMKAIKDACIILQSTYVCIDEEAPIGGIYEGWFREFAQETNDIDVEDRLPGVYWCQIVSEKMLVHTGSIEEIIRRCPFECAEIINSNGERMLWIEIADSIQKTTHKKRLEMRRFFEKSLYTISLKKASESNATDWDRISYAPPSVYKNMIKNMKRIPLSNDEIAIIQKG